MDRKYSYTFQSNTKYVIVCGGGISGLGKGVTTSSIGLILQKSGYTISVIKIDPYLNIDAGTMSPFEHGEVFILEDGGEADLDLGNYERFMGLKLKAHNNITSGKIYESVLKAERQGLYLGKTVQVVPHVTNRIIKWIEDVASESSDPLSSKAPEIVLIEVGGTVGDIESMAYYEAIRQMIRTNTDNFCMIFLCYVPYIGASGEQKTKISQMGIKELRHVGLFPDIIIGRTTGQMVQETKEKIALFSGLSCNKVIGNQDVTHLLEVIVNLEQQQISKLILEKLKLKIVEPQIDFYKKIQEKQKTTIAIVGKYTQFKDAYTSLIKALEFSAIEAYINLKIEWINAQDLEDSKKEQYQTSFQLLKKCQGILVPGGFGVRGIEGKINAIQYAREQNIPFFGICLGFQLASIEYARNVIGIKNATSEEFNTENGAGTNVVIFMPESSITQLGGTMRLGSKHTQIQNTDSLAFKIYGEQNVYERHRHRYEINPDFIQTFFDNGLVFSGMDIKKDQPRMIQLELPNKLFFFAVQYHPEMQNTIEKPNKCFLAFLLAASGKLEERLKQGDGVIKYQNEWRKQI